MRRWVVVGLLGWMVALGAHAAESPFPQQTKLSPPAQPMKMPDFEFANLQGGVLKSSEMKGKVIVIRFWATW